MKMQLAQSQVLRKFDLLTLYSVFIVLNFLDTFITSYLILKLDYSVEGNPILRWLLVQTDTVLILWFWKFIMLSLVALTTRLCNGTKYEFRWQRIMILANLVMLSVVIWGAYWAIEI